MAKRLRLAPHIRRKQLLEAASVLITAQGHLPIRVDELATRIGVSKALIYAYFPTQHDMFNAVLDQQFDELEASGLVAASHLTDVRSALLKCADLYLSQVAVRGPVAHYLLRDLYMAGHFNRPVLVRRDKIFRALAKQVRREFALPVNECLSALNMSVTIPEELGQMVFRDEMPMDRARALCVTLLNGCIAAVTPDQRG